MQFFEKEISDKIQKKYPELEVIFSSVPNSDMGHLSIPCFTYSKNLRRSPLDIAMELATIIKELSFIEKTEVVSGYLNCFIDTEILFKSVIEDVFSKGERYGSNQSGLNQRALIEHTSINPNASPHVGRARNAMIGDSIVRLLRFEGYQVEVHYFVNDIGKQIAMLLLGSSDKQNVVFKDLLDIYIEINHKVKENPELEEDVFKLLYQLENGDLEIKERFRKLVNICIEGQTKILNDLGIRYDVFDYESDYLFNDKLKDVLEAYKKTGFLEEDEEGRYVLNQSQYDLPMKSPYLVLTRKDKTSLYPLRDIAFTIDKAKKDVDRNIIVLGEDQKLYHQQICSALEVLNYKAPEVVHYSFVLLSEGKMATRNGTVVLLEDFMEEAFSKAKVEILKRRDTVDEQTARSIANGAVKYSILKTSNEKNVTFDWDSALSFEGDSGPYLQYCLARINSIIRKAQNINLNSIQYNLLTSHEEIELILEISKLYATIKLANKTLSPHIIANYLFSLTQKFTRFYHEHSVLSAENQNLITARYGLVVAVKQVILNCFSILGIDSIEEM